MLYLKKSVKEIGLFVFSASMGCIRDSLGSDYVGTISSTVTERECQRWDDQAPHQHAFTDPSVYSDTSVPDAHNFCRNLDDDPNGPLCFSNDPNIRRQTCNVPLCRGILLFQYCCGPARTLVYGGPYSTQDDHLGCGNFLSLAVFQKLKGYPPV